VIEENHIGKRPVGRLKLRWEDGVKREVERLESIAEICNNFRGG